MVEKKQNNTKQKKLTHGLVISNCDYTNKYDHLRFST